MSHKELDEEYIVELESWDGNPLRVTNLEKTIIDVKRYKHAIPDIIEEMLDDYLDRDNHDFRRLERYAREFNCILQDESAEVCSAIVQNIAEPGYSIFPG